MRALLINEDFGEICKLFGCCVVRKLCLVMRMSKNDRGQHGNEGHMRKEGRKE